MMFRKCYVVAKLSLGLIALFFMLGGMSVDAQDREGKVVVTDSVESEEDYSNTTLNLPTENPKVVIKWELPVENAKEFHVYIKPKEAQQSVFLGRVEANDNALIWEKGAKNLNPTFREGPKEGIYTFRVFALIPSTPRPTVYGPVPNDGPVKIVIGSDLRPTRIPTFPSIRTKTPTPTPTPKPSVGARECVEAGDVFSSAASGLSTVNLGLVSIEEALLPDGSPVNLNVTDCDGNGKLDVNIPWSESNATRKASITFSPNICNGDAPKVVELYLRHGTPIKLEALDESGSLVDTASHSSSNPSMMNVLVLSSSTGIREIKIDGAEICLLRICWYCRGDVDLPTRTPQIEPTIEPGDRLCVDADEFFNSAASGLSVVNLGAVSIREALLPDGSPVSLNVTDCDNDGQLDVEIPWSESNATRKASIKFSPNLCNGNAPKVVEIFLRHGTAIKLEAIDDNGSIVDAAGNSGSDPTIVDKLVLTSATGIREILVEGAEICLLRICWYCRGEIDKPTPTFQIKPSRTPQRTPDIDRPTRTPFIEPTKYPEDCDCAEAGDVYSSQARGLSVVNLGLVKIQEALLPDGSAVNLNITDCDSDGRLDIEIPWSESNATRNAVIEFSPNICNGNAPKVVELVLRHGTQIKLQAFDDSGALVDTAVRLSSDPSVVETIGLFSSSGIREIVVEGAEICLHRICWCCRGDIDRPTPTFQIRPTRTPPVVIRTKTPTPGDIVRPTPVIPVGEVVVLDNMETYHDLSNGVDVDPKGKEALVLRWKDNENVINPQEYHIYVSVDNNKRLYLGQTPGTSGNVFLWAKNAPGLNKFFANGPEPGHTYMFTIFGLTGQNEVKIVGPYKNAGPVKFMVGEESPSIRFLGWQESNTAELITNVLVVQANKPNQRVCLAYHVGDSLFQNCYPLPLGTELNIPIRVRHSTMGEVNVTAVIQERGTEGNWVDVENTTVATSPTGQ